MAASAGRLEPGPCPCSWGKGGPTRTLGRGQAEGHSTWGCSSEHSSSLHPKSLLPVSRSPRARAGRAAPEGMCRACPAVGSRNWGQALGLPLPVSLSPVQAESTATPASPASWPPALCWALRHLLGSPGLPRPPHASAWCGGAEGTPGSRGHLHPRTAGPPALGTTSPCCFHFSHFSNPCSPCCVNKIILPQKPLAVPDINSPAICAISCAQRRASKDPFANHHSNAPRT